MKSVQNLNTNEWTFYRSYSLQLMYLLQCKWKTMIATQRSWSSGINWYFRVYFPWFIPLLVMSLFLFGFVHLFPHLSYITLFWPFYSFFVMVDLGNLVECCWPQIQKLLFCDGKLRNWFLIIYVALCFVTHKVAEIKHLNLP